MTSQAEATLPRQITPALFTKKSAFDVSRMAATISPASQTAPAAPAIGQRMPDGTVYAGISPDNGRSMYTTPKDTGLCASWYKALHHAAKLEAHGHDDWRVPTKDELNQLFQHRAAIGNFDETGSTPAGWYWSSSQNGQYRQYLAWVQRFSNGYQSSSNYKGNVASLRCVRG